MQSRPPPGGQSNDGRDDGVRAIGGRQGGTDLPCKTTNPPCLQEIGHGVGDVMIPLPSDPLAPGMAGDDQHIVATPIRTDTLVQIEPPGILLRLALFRG